MKSLYKKFPRWCAHFNTVVIVGAAFVVRTWLLGGFEPAIPYLTFYPAVMLAALLGGVQAGLFASLLSGLLATYYFIEPVGNFHIENSRDALGLLIFILSSILASCIGELFMRHRARLVKNSEELSKANNALESEIAKRGLLERRLADSELHFRTLANSGQALIWTSTPDKLCDYFNETWLTFTGRTLEQELGNGWAEGVHPEDFQRCLDIYSSAFDRREGFSMEYRLRHRSGEYRWIADQGVPRFGGGGEFLGFIGHCLDITGLKQAEEELRDNRALLEREIQVRLMSEEQAKAAREFSDMVIEMSGTPLMVLDREGRIVRFNGACKAASGYDSGEAIGRRPWGFLLVREDEESAREAFARVVSGNSVGLREEVWVRKDGGRCVIAWNIATILNGSGEVEYIIENGTDVTAQRREMRAMETFSSPVQASATAATLGLKGLSQGHPALFMNLVAEFEILLDRALEQLVFKEVHDISSKLDEMVGILGSMNAGPRDATEIYVSALKHKSDKLTPGKYKAYCDEGRIVFIEFMGKLVAYYRNHCLGLGSPPRAGNRPSEGGGHG